MPSFNHGFIHLAEEPGPFAPDESGAACVCLLWFVGLRMFMIYNIAPRNEAMYALGKYSF